MKIRLDTLRLQCLELAEFHLTQADPGHDLSHSRRVAGHALHIQSIEGGSAPVILAAACLHDLMDAKFFLPEKTWPVIAQFLSRLHFQQPEIELVRTVISHMSYSKQQGGVPAVSLTELDVVQDADRLEAIGAIGIARAFSYGGFRSRPFYHPNGLATLDHFHEKLFKLESLMRTATGKEMARHRARFLHQFVAQFISECPTQEQFELKDYSWFAVE